MSNLRIEIEIHKGIRGIPLEKLAQIVADLQRFLVMLSEDVGLGAEPGGWIGLDFDNGSLAFIAEKTESVTSQQVVEFNAAFVSIVQRHPMPQVRRGTIYQYAKIADPIAPEEVVTFKLFAPEPEKKPSREWPTNLGEPARIGFLRAPTPLHHLQLTKSEAISLQADVQAKVRAYGALQGRIHSLFLGSRPAYFNLRELSTGSLIKCVYKADIYAQIASALQTRDAVLHVYGYTTTDLVERKMEEMEVSKVHVTPSVTSEEFNELFGSQPQFSGRLTTQEFINYARDRGN